MTPINSLKQAALIPVSSNVQNLGLNSGGDVLGTAGVDFVSFYNHNLADVTIFEDPEPPSKAGTNSDLWYVGYSWDNVSKDGSSNIISGTASLRGIERIHFIDTSYALDLDIDENAGAALALLYAAFDNMPDAVTFGKWIAKADSLGNQSESKSGSSDDSKDIVDLAQSMIEYYAPQGVSNSNLVTLLYSNIVNQAPTAEQQQYYVDLIDNGSYSQASFLAMAAQTEQNTIQYVGLTQDGLAYTQESSKQG